MGMFVIEKGTKVIVIKDKTEWYSKNFKDFVTTKTNVFDKGEMIIDPTGIAKWCSLPSHERTIGGDFARKGYFGFKRDGYYMLVHANYVQYA